jgi:hypothetical protein
VVVVLVEPSTIQAATGLTASLMRLQPQEAAAAVVLMAQPPQAVQVAAVQAVKHRSPVALAHQVKATQAATVCAPPQTYRNQPVVVVVLVPWVATRQVQ